MLEFVIAIRKHQKLSYIFSAYLIEKAEEDRYKIISSVDISDIQKKTYNFTLQQREILEIMDSYSVGNLMKVFGNKKQSQIQFLKSITESKTFNSIKTLLDRKFLKIYRLAVENNIRIFYKDANQNQLHKGDQYTSHKNNATTLFLIRKTADGILYRLSLQQDNQEIKLIDNPGFVFINNPCLLVLNKKFYFFQDIDGKKLNPFFEKEFIKIPASAEKKWLENFAKKTIEKYHVKTEGFNVEELSEPLKVKLIVKENWRKEVVLSMKFNYGQHSFSINDLHDSKVLFDENKTCFYKIKRDKVKENEAIKQVQNLGLSLYDNSYFKVNAGENSPTSQLHKMLMWLARHKQLLLQQGFEISQNLGEKIFIIQKPTIKFSTTEQHDWFDVKALVDFGRFQIPFSKLRNNILNEIPEYTLPDGTIAVIPNEWFAKYTDILRFAEGNDEVLRLQKIHFKVLPKAKEALPETSCLKKLSSISDLKKIQVPKQIKAKLRPYQEEGFRRMYTMQEANLGLCLADDMGLGKTLQTIALLQKTKNERIPPVYDLSSRKGEQLSLFFDAPKDDNNQNQTAQKAKEQAPSLVVVPVSLLHNWTNELKKFSPTLKVLKYHGSLRHRHLKSFSKYDVILTGYGIVRNDIEKLTGRKFLYIILDESQYIKNPSSQIYKAVIKLKSEYKLALTGTPIENSLSDFWSQMNFINPGILGNYTFFKKHFQNPIEKKHNEEIAHKLKHITSPFILRRTKQQVAKDLPPINEQVVYCEMSDEQRAIYEIEKTKIRNELINANFNRGANLNPVKVIQALSKLRQIANHPALIDENYDADSGKFMEIIHAIENIIEEGHKLLLFSSFVKHLNLFKKYFDEKNISYSLLTGSTVDRETEISKFQNDTNNKVFLISLKAGGTGLNLTAADYVFLADPWWNPAAEQQAINRAHRIGQDKKVFVYKYISNNTVEEKILKLQSKKQKLSEEFITNENILKFTNDIEIKSLFE